MGETNEEFVVRIMNFCPYGALGQVMVIEALRNMPSWHPSNAYQR